MQSVSNHNNLFYFPIEIVRYIVNYLTLKEIVKLDQATLNKNDREIYLQSVDGLEIRFISYFDDNRLESQVNWNEPIILCEGVFDAITIKRNAIPLLGKFPSRNLVEKIFMSGVSDIIISLDSDAINEALKAAEYFRKQGINVKMMYMEDKDASEIGYKKFYEQLKKTKEFSSEELLLNKINSL
jgi:hypothetical protein